ncbi:MULTISPECIES: NlpC/P60 family protein [unclassified Streptomyces]|uniref:C40 family peptidase n=1 Tax=unclassified Streptomyces TaxID=2593676 RepID=UPI000CD5115D|nr:MULTISPECIES: C40 family peptidase [unclassified Streptomyces]
MASHRRPKQPSRARVSVFGAAAAATVALSSQSAHADPNPSKAEVKERVDELHEEATEITEEYNGAMEQEEQLKEEAEELQTSVARGQEELNELRNSVGSVASAQYRNGGMTPSVQLFLSADPDRYLDRASTLDQVTGKQAEVLRNIESKQRTLAQQREEATTKLETLEETRGEIKEKKDAIQAKLGEARELLNRLTEEERQQLQAEERAAEAEAQRQAEAAADRASRSEGRTDSPSATTTPVADSGSGSSYAQSAISAAQSKIGSPYVFGNTGPHSFDCSGLTGWAYKQAGISLPRTSQAQANAGTRVSQSQLQPGDLVFYYAGITHVGIYVGNGQILHAPRTGSTVSYAGVNSMPFQFGVRVA